MQKQDLEIYRKKLMLLKEYLTQEAMDADESFHDQDGKHHLTLNHLADAGSDAFEEDMTMLHLEHSMEVLSEIEDAFTRIERKEYGECEMCGKKIPKIRLDAMPYARFDIQCQEKYEEENGLIIS